MKTVTASLTAAAVLALFFVTIKNTRDKKITTPEESPKTNRAESAPSFTGPSSVLPEEKSDALISALSKPDLTRLDIEAILLPALENDHGSVIPALARSEAPIDYETIGGIIYHYFSNAGGWGDHEKWLALASEHTDLGNYLIPIAILAWSNENQEDAESFIFNNREGNGVISAAKATAQKTVGLGVIHSGKSLNEKLDPSHPVDRAYLKGVFEGLVYFGGEGAENLTKSLLGTPLGDQAIVSYLEASKLSNLQSVEWIEKIKDGRLRKIKLIDSAPE